MTIYKLKNRGTNWGDYGDILISGMTAHLERQDELLQLERTGPFIPPLVNSGLWDIVITDRVKKNLEDSGLMGISFRSVLKKHIVELDWTAWDLTLKEPPIFPDSGEPEDYILAGEHSEKISKLIGDVWELVTPTRGTFVGENFIDGRSQADIFKADNRGYILVTDKAKDWIEKNAGDWVRFEIV
jgi:hypothetical protein